MIIVFFFFAPYLGLSETCDFNIIGWFWQRLYMIHHGLYHIHYINLDVCRHFLLMAVAPFRPYIVPSLIPDKMIPCGWLCPRMTFFFLYFIPLYLHWILILLYFIPPLPHFQQSLILSLDSYSYSLHSCFWSCGIVILTLSLLKRDFQSFQRYWFVISSDFPGSLLPNFWYHCPLTKKVSRLDISFSLADFIYFLPSFILFCIKWEVKIKVIKN